MPHVKLLGDGTVKVVYYPVSLDVVLWPVEDLA